MTSRPPRCLLASTMALCSPHRTSGLFDTGTPGKAGFLSETLNTPDVLKTIDASQLFSGVLTEGTDKIPLDGTGLDTPGNEVPLAEFVSTIHEPQDASGSKDFSASGNQSEFFEGFVDLSSFLAQGDPLPDLMEVSSVCIDEQPEEHNTVKRTVTVAFSQPEPPTPNPDHDDYTSKAKKPRLSLSDPSIDSTGAGPSAEFKTTVKYQERRRKNNIASRRSRESRKQKFASMEQRAEELQSANLKLECQVAELEGLTKLMQSILVHKLTGKQ